MATATINTLGFARKLRDRGLDERAADAIAEEVGQFVVENTTHPDAIERIEKKLDITSDRIEKNMATKAELAEVRTNQRWQQWGIKLLVALVVSDIVIQLLA